MQIRQLSAIALGIALASCTSAEVSPEDSYPSLAADKSKPQMALADHILGNYFASESGPRLTTCISTNDGRSEVALAPEDELELMLRYPSLAPFSRCGLIDGAWQDVDTGQPAIVFTLHTFSCADLATCSGFGGFMSGDTSSMTSRYSMDYDGREWNFTRDDRLIGEN